MWLATISWKYNGKELNNVKTIFECKLKPGVELEVMLRLKGGAKKRKKKRRETVANKSSISKDDMLKMKSYKEADDFTLYVRFTRKCQTIEGCI